MAIKVLIVDDSLVFRESLSRSLSADASIKVIGTAADAFSAKEKVLELNPDVVTLDVEMPKMNGIDFLKKLLPVYSVPVVVVTATAGNAFDAMNAGAVDYVKKPLIKSPADMEDFARTLVQKVKIASVAKIKLHSAGKASEKPAVSRIASLNSGRSRNLVIALGASTGGTDALQTVVQEFPEDAPGVVIVQHMPSGFTKMYAERLNKICRMKCKEAEDGDRVEQGKIIIAAGGLQMRLEKDANGYYVTSREGEKVSGHRPSVDVLFDSVADAAGKNAIAAILTGMGSDGAKGLKKLRDAGGFTIGQDKESCVVYGMPMVAYNIGAVCQQAPLNKIPRIILSKCK